MKRSELIKIKEIVENADFTSEQAVVVGKAIAVIQKEFEEHYNASTSGGALYKIMKALDALNDGTESTKEVLDFVKRTTLSVCGWERDEKELERVLEPKSKNIPDEEIKKFSAPAEMPRQSRSYYDDRER